MFQRLQTQTKTISLLAYSMSIISLEFQIYILIDSRSSNYLRALVLYEIPSMCMILFVNFYLMSEFNSKSKWILVELDQCLHKIAWPGDLKIGKMTLFYQRELIASDQIAINMADIFYLVRWEIVKTIFQMVNMLFLIIDVNR